MGKRFNEPEWLACERGLIERARAGSRDAMAKLYEAFAPALYAEVLMPRLGGDAAAAEDALAETFREVFVRLGDWRDEGKSLWSFAARVAMTKAIDVHRARSREGRALTNYARLVAPILPEPEDPGEAIAREADGARIRERVAAILAAINERYRRAIELRFFEERSREACAEALCVSVATFDVVLLRAVRAFRKEWEGEEKSNHGDTEERSSEEKRIGGKKEEAKTSTSTESSTGTTTSTAEAEARLHERE